MKSPKRGEGGSQPCRYLGKGGFQEKEQHVQRPGGCIMSVLLEQQRGQCGVAREVGVWGDNLGL